MTHSEHLQNMTKQGKHCKVHKDISYLFPHIHKNIKIDYT